MAVIIPYLAQQRPQQLLMRARTESSAADTIKRKPLFFCYVSAKEGAVGIVMITIHTQYEILSRNTFI